VSVAALIEDQNLWQQTSSAALEYYTSHHTLDAVMPKFVELFQRINR
jgi:hypothetical protein